MNAFEKYGLPDPASSAEPQSAFAKHGLPEPVSTTQAIAQSPRSAIGEIANQGYAGLVSDLPRMAGKAMQYSSDPGNQVYEYGKGLADWATKQGERQDLQPNPDQHNVVTNALASGARMIPQSIAPAAAIGATIAAAPVAVSGAGLLGASALLGSLPAAMSQGQETLDKGLEKGLPRDKAIEAARINALIEGGGETLGTYAGGKLFGIGAKAIGKTIGAGVEGGAGKALQAISNPQTFKPWLKQLPQTALVETGTEIGQNAGEAAVENAYGVSNQSPYEAGKEAIAPTLGMTALLAPFGLAGFAGGAHAARQKASALASPEVDPNQRAQIAQDYFTELNQVDPAAANEFARKAKAAIATSQPLTIDESLFKPSGPMGKAVDSGLDSGIVQQKQAEQALAQEQADMQQAMRDQQAFDKETKREEAQAKQAAKQAPQVTPESGQAGSGGIGAAPDSVEAPAGLAGVAQPVVTQGIAQEPIVQPAATVQAVEPIQGEIQPDGTQTQETIPAAAGQSPAAAAASLKQSSSTPNKIKTTDIASDIADEKLNREWTAFSPESGSLGIPRAEMPQIKADHRGAMTNFMNARGVQHQKETVDSALLHPTQLEFSPAKVKKAMGFDGGDRSILVSSDNYVLDGHHQWLARRQRGEPINIIRLGAPIRKLISLAHEFPSSRTAEGAKTIAAGMTTPAQPTTGGILPQQPTALPMPASGRNVHTVAEKPATVRARKIAVLKEKLRTLKPFDDGHSEVSGALTKEISRDTEDAISAGDIPVYRVNDSGLFIAVHPSAQQDGMVQVTRYDKSGVLGDSQYKSAEEAVRFESLIYKDRLPQKDAEAAMVEAIAAESKRQEIAKKPVVNDSLTTEPSVTKNVTDNVTKNVTDAAAPTRLAYKTFEEAKKQADTLTKRQNEPTIVVKHPTVENAFALGRPGDANEVTEAPKKPAEQPEKVIGSLSEEAEPTTPLETSAPKTVVKQGNAGQDIAPVAPAVETHAPAEKAAQKAEAAQENASDDWLSELFGTPEQQEERLRIGKAQESENNATKKARADKIRTAIAEQIPRTEKELETWKNKVYKRNAKRVEFRGDGPARHESMSVGAINDSHKRKAIDILTVELVELKKLNESVSTDAGAELVFKKLEDIMARAKTAFATGNWPNIESEESMFEYMLLDALKATSVPGGRGGIQSNGLSKAMLSVVQENVTPKAEPAEKPSLEARKAAILDERARKIAAQAPKLTSLAERLREAAKTATGARKAALEGKLQRMEAAKPVEQKVGISTIKAKTSPIHNRDDLVGAIMRVTGGDGIHSSMAVDTAGDTANRLTKLRGLFTNRGTQDLGDVAMLLREEEGYDVKDGEALSELIRRAAAGDVAVSMERQQADAEADRDKQHRDDIRRQAKKLGIKSAFVKFSDLEVRVFAMMETRLNRVVTALDARSRKRFDKALVEAQGLISEQEIDAILADMSRRGLKPREFWNEGAKTIRGMIEDARIAQMENDYGQDNLPDFEDGNGRGNQGFSSADPFATEDEATRSEPFSLEGQTLSDIDRQEAERVAAAKKDHDDLIKSNREESARANDVEKDRRAAEVLKEREAAKKAEVDKSAEMFELGQDAPKPVVKKVTIKDAAGQKDVFSDDSEQKPVSSSGTDSNVLSGHKRNPENVSVFSPYNDGDIVRLSDGKDWQVKNDMQGWYLTNTGNWRGTHQTIKNIKAMIDLIRAVEQASQQKPVQPAKAERGEVGASLTKEQRKSVLKTLIDVYKTKRAPREHKGVDQNGNDKYGYVHSPDLFEKSDITGAMIRYVVTLPDGRIAHPTELFADYTQSNIDKAMAESRAEETRDADNAKWLNEQIDKRANADRIDARRALSAILAPNGNRIDDGAVEFYSEVEGKWFVVQNRTVADSYAKSLSSRGYKEVAKYSNDAPQGEKPRWLPKEYADGTKPAKAEKPAQDYAEGDEIRFTANNPGVGQRSVIEGILVQKADTNGGNFRLRIRTSEANVHGGGNVTPQVYSQDGTIERLSDGLNASIKNNETSPRTNKAQEPKEQGKPSPGRYIEPSNRDNGATSQRIMADRAGRTATLSVLNDAVRKVNPDAAYSDDQILNVATDKIDDVRDWLVEQGRKAQPAKPEPAAKPEADDTRFNVASNLKISPADSAVYEMARDGKSAAEILDFIAKASRRPFNRYLANALKRMGVSPTFEVGMPFVRGAVGLEHGGSNAVLSQKQPEGNNVSAASYSNMLEQHSLLRHLDNLLKIPSNLGMLGDSANGVNSNAPPKESGLNSVRVDAETLRNVIKQQAFIEKGFSGLDIKAQRAVSAAVLRSSKNLKILDSVIKLIPVDVVNMLRAKKLSPKMLLHDPAMLKHALSGNLGFNVSAGRNASDALVRSIALSAAIENAGQTLSDIHRLSLNGGATVGAINSNHGIDYTRLYDASGRPKYSAAYNPKADAVILLSPRKAEIDALHELVHAATLKALSKRGMAAMQMRALFKHVQASGKLSGMYGMSEKGELTTEQEWRTIEEFVAEAFSNPKFQQALKEILAPSGSKLKSAWQWFVRLVSRAVGFKTQAQETALDRAMTVGAQLMAENAQLSGKAEGTRYAIAHHGTPHLFAPEPGFPHGRFRLDKMGTGEGAAAYGWGVYFAEKYDVAKAYKNALSKFSAKIDGESIVDTYSNGTLVNLIVEKTGISRQEAIRASHILAKHVTSGKGLNQLFNEEIEKAAEFGEKEVSDTKKLSLAIIGAVQEMQNGTLYRLDIPDDVMPKLMDWDAPLREQPAAVRKALLPIIEKSHEWSKTARWPKDATPKPSEMLNVSGEMLLKHLTSNNPHGKPIEDVLRDAGIPGLRYLDGQSRTDGEGTHNYVIWDQPTLDRIALLERNGEKLDDIRFSQESDTINVDGTERPRTNSNGKPIAGTDEALRKFYAWFGDSKVVDSEGRPLVVYHGTNSEFGVFRTDAGPRSAMVGDWNGAHFTNDSAQADGIAGSVTRMGGGQKRVVGAYLKAERPVEYGKFRTQEQAIAAGHDSRLTENNTGLQEWTVFEPNQIKSADQNNGEFSPDNPDIRYNVASDWLRAASSPQVQQTIANVLASDSSTSWITPFNTQFHKAQKWAAEGKPWFKKVFDLGQLFLSDVSRFAVMAQSAAPTLFHEIKGARGVVEAIKGVKSLGDITGKTRADDANAIATPLYEGTLHGGGSPMKGKIYSDAELRALYSLNTKQIKLYREALAAVNVSMDEMAKSIIAKHAKNEEVSFDASLSVDQMAKDIIQSLEDIKADIGNKAMMATQAELKNMDPENPKSAGDSQRKMAQIVENAEKQNDRIDKTIKDVRGVVSTNKSLQEHGYFPLMRFGENTVTAKDEEGNVQFFGMYEGVPLVPRSGQYQANKVAAEIRSDHPEWTVTTGIHNTEKFKLYQGMNLEAVQLFAAHMDAESKEPFQEFLRIATNDRSVQKRLIHRKGTPGFDRDVRRTLAQFITSNARHTSSSYHLFDMRKAANSVPDQYGDIGKESVNLYKYISEPMEEAQKLRGFMFFNYLGGSIASAMVNTTQIPAMTFPFLNKYESAGVLGKRLALAGKMAMGNPADITGSLGDALRRAEQDGVTAPQEIHQLMATASNNIFAGSQGVNLFMQGWGKLFAMAESFNRMATFIAAFQIAEKMTPAQLAEAKAKNAFEFAENAVKETQGIYNKGNRPNVGRGATGATLMTFKQYSIMYLELLKRLPQKQRMMMMGVLMLSAGSGGLPFEEDIEDIIDTFGQWLGFATNTHRTIRKAASSVLGDKAADIALNGLFSQIGIDVHSRLGMQNLLPGTGILKQSSTDKGRDIEEFFGPAGSLIGSVGKALENLATGHAGRAALDVAPVAVQNAIKGAKMAATGYAEDSKGRRTVPVDLAESIAKGVGFNPKSVADFGAMKRGIAQDTRLMNVKREEFSSALVDAILSGDTEARKEAMEEIRKWNQDNPKMMISINPGAIAKRVQAARMEGSDRFLKSTPKALRSEAAADLRR